MYSLNFDVIACKLAVGKNKKIKRQHISNVYWNKITDNIK